MEVPHRDGDTWHGSTIHLHLEASVPTLRTVSSGLVPTLTLTLAFLLGLAFSASSLSATDCGGSYVRCLAEADALGGSDALHEPECYADYWKCVTALLIAY